MKKIKCVKLESVVCNLRSIIFVFVMVLVFKSSSLWLSGGWYVYQQRNEVHNNCGIEIYYQTDMQNTNENMLLELLCQIISEPCFNTLRTKEQLGNTNTQEKCSAVCGNTHLLSINVMIGQVFLFRVLLPLLLRTSFIYISVCPIRLHSVQRPPQGQWSAGSAFHHPVWKSSSLPGVSGGGLPQGDGEECGGDGRGSVSETHPGIGYSPSRQTQEAGSRMCQVLGRNHLPTVQLRQGWESPMSCLNQLMLASSIWSFQIIDFDFLVWSR